MSGQISVYETRTLLAAIETMLPARTFLKDTFFNVPNTFTTESVDVEYRKGRRKMAPFVSPRMSGRVTERAGFTTKSFKPARIKPKRVITGDDIQKRSLGENIYSTKSPDQRAIEMVANDLAEMDEEITRREEWMIAQILTTGKVDIIGEGVDQQLDFDFTNKVILSGTDTWGNADSNPYEDLMKWRLKVLQASGVTPNTVILSSDVVMPFLSNPNVSKLLDNRNAYIGKIDPKALPNGVTYYGTFAALGVDVYSYDEWYYDEEAGEEKPMIPEGTVIIGSSNARSHICYGAVTLTDNKTNNFITYEGARIPDSWVKKDPAARFMQLHSNPVPVPHEVDSWLVATVL